LVQKFYLIYEEQKIRWQANDLASGVYFYRLLVGGDSSTGFTETQKLIFF